MHLLILPILLAQHAHPAPPAEKPVALLPGMGKYSRPIGTSNAIAQKFFDQGLNLHYGFNRYESFRSFKKAAELDPSNPWPKWGIALSKGPYINGDLDGTVDMKAYCEALSGLQTPFAEAARTRCPDGADDPYIAAMKRLAADHPDDPDAATLYADALLVKTRWKWFAKDGRAAPGVEEAIAVLESVMRRWPDHPGANHLYIHAVESSQTPERAIPSAQRLMGIMPGAGHMVHMPGHIWLLTGDYEMAATVNDRAVQLDQEYFAKTGVQGSYAMYMAHNMHFVAHARQMQGRRADALKAAQTMASAVAGFAEAMPEMVDAFVPYPMFVMVRFERWEEVLALKKPSEKLPLTLAMWHWARAVALTGLKRDASGDAAQFRQAAARLPEQAMWLSDPAKLIVDLAAHLLDARMAADPKAAVDSLRKAVALEDQLSYDEPPHWYYPIRESLGAALLRDNRPAEAEAAFRDGLQRSPRNGRMLFGLAEGLRRQGKQEAAAMVDREQQEAWRRADIKLALAGL